MSTISQRAAPQEYDIVIIGAGMAGAGIAAELARQAQQHMAGGRRILLAEGEDQPGYHTTGRSAAFWEECYGGPQIVPLTLASGAYLREGGYLAPRPGLYVARAGQADEVDRFMHTFADTGVTIERIGRVALEQIVPGIRAGWDHGIFQPHCADIDVAGLHQHYLASARRAGVVARNRHRLLAAERSGGQWRLDFGLAGEVVAATLVNAAGAWASQIARLCGAAPIAITPYQRTVIQLRVAPEPPPGLPMVLDLAGRFYFRPENARLWLSPHDETPSAPCDAAPEEMDVAQAIDRFEGVVDWQVRALERKWAGLRSFAPDRRPVYGFDTQAEGFFWCAGQGGFGIQTAPAASRMAAQALLGLPADAMTATLDPALYAPARFG